MGRRTSWLGDLGLSNQIAEKHVTLPIFGTLGTRTCLFMKLFCVFIQFFLSFLPLSSLSPIDPVCRGLHARSANCMVLACSAWESFTVSQHYFTPQLNTNNLFARECPFSQTRSLTVPTTSKLTRSRESLASRSRVL